MATAIVSTLDVPESQSGDAEKDAGNCEDVFFHFLFAFEFWPLIFCKKNRPVSSNTGLVLSKFQITDR